jgi:hypothetical protein
MRRSERLNSWSNRWLLLFSGKLAKDGLQVDFFNMYTKYKNKKGGRLAAKSGDGDR